MSCLNKRIQFMRPRKNLRCPSRYPTDGAGIPLRITRLFPMKLKDVTVSSLEMAKKESDVICVQEMMSLFDCFEKHDFNSSLCQAQSKALENCYSTQSVRREESKAKRKQAAASK